MHTTLRASICPIGSNIVPVFAILLDGDSCHVVLMIAECRRPTSHDIGRAGCDEGPKIRP